jgi:SnoaL-like protein
VSVIGSGPGEGHDKAGDVSDLHLGGRRIRLESGANPRGWEEENVGFAIDKPRFVLPDGSFLQTRVTGVLRREDDDWKIVHLHFSVGVPDEEAIQQPR